MLNYIVFYQKMGLSLPKEGFLAIQGMTHKKNPSKYIISEEKAKNFGQVSQNILVLTS